MFRGKQYASAIKDGSSATQAASHVSCRNESRSCSRSVKMRQLAKERKALLDFFACQLLQPLGAKALDSERAHHAAIKHRAFERSRSHFFLRCKISKEPAGKQIASSRWVHDFAKRQ